MPPQSIILVVEDDAAVTAALYEVLSFHGYRIITAASAQEAERALQRLGVAQIHLVISDIHLTRNTQACEGYALYQRWRHLYPALPFMLISAYPNSRDLPAIRAQTVPFLEKPFAIDALLQCVREATGQAIDDECQQPQTA